MGKKEYMEILLAQIRNNKAKKFVGEEIEAHIDDQTDAYMEYGLDQDTAEKKAVRSMGDPVEVGGSLDRIHKPKISWSMIVLVAILSAFGLIMQFLVGMETDNLYYFQRQVVYVIVGFAVMIVICLVDYSRIVQHGKLLALAYLAVSLEFMLRGGIYSGSHIYLSFGRIGVSYHFILFLSIPLFGILLYQCRRQSKKHLLIPVGFMAAVLWFYWETSYGLLMVLNLIFMAAIVLTYAIVKDWYPVKKKRFLGTMWTCVLGIPLLMTGTMLLTVSLSGDSGYRSHRIQSFLSGDDRYAFLYGQYKPFSDVMGNLSWLGNPVAGQGQSDNGIYAVSDYILLHAVSSYGMILLLAVIVLLAVFCIKIFRLSVGQKNQAGTIIGIGCGLVFAVQIAEYVMMNLGVIPGTTAFLPLFSYGGSGTIVSFILLGLLLSIYRYQNLVTEKKKKRKKLVMKIVEM